MKTPTQYITLLCILFLLCSCATFPKAETLANHVALSPENLSAINGTYITDSIAIKYQNEILWGKSAVVTAENHKTFKENPVYNAITDSITFPKAAFAGKWEYPQQHNSLVLVIKFEQGKDYATIIDVGTGEAPPFQLKAKMLNDRLVIFPQTHVNDLHIEMTVKNNKLFFKSQIAILDKDGNSLPPKINGFSTRIYQRVASK
jgi:hypothetical protein